MKPQSPHFNLTSWSLVARIKDPVHRRRGLEDLCNSYWYPVYAAIRRWGHGEADAEDHTQAFFLHLLEKNTFEKADPAQGRFRTFILSCLTNFLKNTDRYDKAQKRDYRKIIAFEDLNAEERYRLEPVDHETPDRLFERSLALEVLRQAEQELEDDRRYAQRQEVFRALRRHLYESDDSQKLSELAVELGLELNTLKSHLSRMRKRFREILRARVARLCVDPEDDRDELIALQNAL